MEINPSIKNFLWLIGQNFFTMEKIVVVASSLLALWQQLGLFDMAILLLWGCRVAFNIAKRVIRAYAGFAQLGGIWLPLPHLLMYRWLFKFFYGAWLAGSIVSGIAMLYRLLFI